MAATLGNGNITFGDGTSQSTAALPLSGGTLTGALSGTSISTTGNVSVGGTFAVGSDFVVYRGIKFPTDQFLSSDAHTLDDYEEGSWTPTVPMHSCYDIAPATYTKIGRVVFAYCYIQIVSNNGTTSFKVSGLPFTCQQSNGFCGSSVNIGGPNYVERGTASAYITKTIPYGGSNHMFMFHYHTYS